VWLLNYLEPAVQAAWDHLYDDGPAPGPDRRGHGGQPLQEPPALLGYDLLNEPFGRIRRRDLAEAVERVQKVQLTAMFQRLSDAIHAVDPEHWVLFEPPNVASLGLPVALGEVHGTKLAYFPHFYDPSIESATYTPGSEVNGFDPAFFDKYEAAIHDYPATYGYPTLFGEWGIAHPENPGMAEFVARSLALMDRQGSGWTMFNWCKGSGYCPLDAQGQDRPAIGQIVAPWAKAIAGHPTTFGFDPATRKLTVSFTDGTATGPSQLQIPSGFYADGYRVSTSDASGTWSSSYDAATGTLDVTTPTTGATHTICLAPAGDTSPCGAVATPVVAPVATPLAAVPVAATPAFTG
jgi:endoglycosylceramidase